MASMVRKQIYIEEQQEARLKERSIRTGLSEAELIRRALDGDRDFVLSLAPDPKAWADARALMLSAAERAGCSREPLRWKREDLYQDRMPDAAARVD